MFSLSWVIMALILLIVSFFVRTVRTVAIRAFLATVIVFVASMLGVGISHKIRTTAYRRLAERSAPLVQAIRTYETRHGSLPVDLAAIVPEFFTTVPGTGMGAYPEYIYHVGESAKSYDGNPWVLVVDASYGMSFDSFMYFPLQNYPTSGYGGWLERVGDWAYVHE